jgi:hypothetical protein
MHKNTMMSLYSPSKLEVGSKYIRSKRLASKKTKNTAINTYKKHYELFGREKVPNKRDTYIDVDQLFHSTRRSKGRIVDPG